MDRSHILLPLVLLTACGHSLWPSTTVVTPVAVAETYLCVDSISRALGYKPFQSKPTEGFLRTRKTVADPSHDVFDQLAYDQLHVEISGAAAGSSLTITAESYTEQVSRRSREQVEQEARPGVVADARTVLDGCGTSQQARPDRVPSVN